jgi:amidase
MQGAHGVNEADRPTAATKVRDLLAHGGDGGGSIRIPSSCCGLFGIKPSRGRVSSAPRLGHVWEGFSTEGPIARYVRDAAALLDVMEGYETGDPYWLPSPDFPFLQQVEDDPGKLRVGLTTTTPTGVPVDPECVAAAKDAAKLLESLGHSVEEATPEWVDDALTDAFIKVVMTQPAFMLFEEPSQLDPVNAALFEAARELTTLDHLKAITALHAVSRRIVAFWNDYDLLLTPTLALPPVEIRVS